MAASFVTMLRSELARRCAKNEAYSLRAFARDLEIDHATLSQMLRGRRALSPAMVERLGRALVVPDALLAAFVRDAKASSTEPNLATDAARILVEPIHEAILDLAERSELVPDTRLYARVLDSDVDAVNVAVQRLVRVGLLVMETETRWTSRLDRDGPTPFDLAIWRHVSRRLAEPKENPSPMSTIPAPKKSPVTQFQIIAKDAAAAAKSPPAGSTAAFGPRLPMRRRSCSCSSRSTTSRRRSRARPRSAPVSSCRRRPCRTATRWPCCSTRKGSRSASFCGGINRRFAGGG